jgi:hypothetical protein
VSDPALVLAQAANQVFSTEDGRLVLEDLRLSFGTRRSFVEGDPYTTAFREGQRDVYLRLCDLLDAVRVKPSRPTQVETEETDG